MTCRHEPVFCCEELPELDSDLRIADLADERLRGMSLGEAEEARLLYDEMEPEEEPREPRSASTVFAFACGLVAGMVLSTLSYTLVIWP